MGRLAGQRIVLGVSGGIAAYKAADLARRLIEAGAQVQVIMTAAAEQFITPMTFQALTGRVVRNSLWDPAAEAAMGHIELARWATRILIAPASADIVARLAHGLANDLLSTVCLASEAPVFVVPAMNRVMWAHPATRANVALLQSRGAVMLGPAEGSQACGETGTGRMLEPAEIVEALEMRADGSQSLAGVRVLISAGPTFEDLDPVRFVGNRSSGKMGFALAAEAALLGAEVTLVAGPVSLSTPADVRRVDVRRAVEMRNAVLAELEGTQVYIGAAAVADYMPVETRPGKLKKTAETLTLELVRTPDVLREVAGHALRPRLVVGFAAETDNVAQHAREKLRSKGLDLIAANDVSAPGIGFEGDENALTVYSADASEEIARGPKRQVARALLAIIARRLEGRV